MHLDTGDSGSEPASDAELIEALRQRSADALERAYGFLQAGDDAWNRLRAEILCQARPPSDLSDAIEGVQAEDGTLPPGSLISGGGLGFPALDPAALRERDRKILGTLEGLLLAGDAKGLQANWVETAVVGLGALQDEDGAFRISPDGTSEPPPDEDAVFWTGMVAGILGRTPFARPALLQKAGAFLAARFDPEAVEHDGYPALLGYSHFYTNVEDDLADEALQWCGRALEKGFRSRRLEAVATLRVLLTCDAQAMPGATFDVTELLERLLEEQAGDGGFAELSLGGPAARMTQTFDGMLAIVRLCAALDA